MSRHKIINRAITWLSIASLPLWGFFTASTKAAFTDDFDELLVELQARSTVLSNSTDKVAQKQFKSVNKAIATINKPGADSLSDDLKIAVKVTKSLQKAFPNEFPSNAAGFSNNLAGLLTNVFENIVVEAGEDLNQLISTVAGLPPSSNQAKAAAAIAQAQMSFADAANAPDFTSF